MRIWIRLIFASRIRKRTREAKNKPKSIKIHTKINQNHNPQSWIRNLDLFCIPDNFGHERLNIY